MEDQRKKDRYGRAQDKYIEKMQSLTMGDETARVIAQALKDGHNSYMKMSRTESSSYDVSWIEAIESCLYELGQIVRNPKKNTKTVEDVVAIEKAKKINSASVRHLATHSEFVKEIDPYGNVIPKKILNVSADDDYAIYENRFIATLIRRLVLFVEKRYEFVTKFAELKDVEGLYFKNSSEVEGVSVEMETKVKIVIPNRTVVATDNTAFVGRIKEMRNYVRYYYMSDFMRKLKNERDVRNPIIQTNILRKNPLYKKCYQLYRFIETYDKLGVNYRVQETYHDFTEDDVNDINLTVLGNFLAAKTVAPLKGYTTDKVYKPKILHSIDDEMFYFGDLYSGPIEFARIDGKYIDYLKTTKWTPDYPTKLEKEYYKDEIQEKRAARERERNLLDLMKRKEKERLEWEKRVAASMAERQKDEEEMVALEAARLKAEDIKRLEDARRKLEIQARKDALKKIHEEEEEAEALSIIEQDKIQAQIEEAKKRAQEAKNNREEVLALLKAAQAAAWEEERKAEMAEAKLLLNASEDSTAYDEQLIKSILRRQVAEKALSEAENKILGNVVKNEVKTESKDSLSGDTLKDAIRSVLSSMGDVEAGSVINNAINASAKEQNNNVSSSRGVSNSNNAASMAQENESIDVHNEEASLRVSEEAMNAMSSWDAKRIREEAEMRRHASSSLSGEQDSSFKGTAPESYDTYANNPYQYSLDGMMGNSFTMNEDGEVTPDFMNQGSKVEEKRVSSTTSNKAEGPITQTKEEVRPLSRDEARRLQLIEARIKARNLAKERKDNPDDYLKEINKRIQERDKEWKKREIDLAFNAMDIHIAKGNIGEGRYIVSCHKGFVTGNKKYSKAQEKALIINSLDIASAVAKAIDGDVVSIEGE